MSILPNLEELDQDGAVREAAEKVDGDTRSRHAGWIRDINGVSGAPRAFEGARTKNQILAAVKGTGFIVS